MSFIPAHSSIVLYALETGTMTESSDGTTAATLPALPQAPVVLGYTNLPQRGRGENNSKGFALGLQGAAYNKRGARTPSIAPTIRPGSLGALLNFFPDPNTGKLPYLAIYVATKGQPTDVYRFCKPASLEFNFGGGQGGQGGELTIGAQFQALVYQQIGALTWTTAQVKALGTPLMWHDVRQFNVTDNAGNTTDYRRALMTLSAKVDYGLERKNERPNWGDDQPLSRTSYELLEHHLNVSGSATLHERLPTALFDGAKNAQDWGNIVVPCSDAVTGNGFRLTLSNTFPSDETGQGGESNVEVDYAVPFTADSLALTLLP